MWDEVRVTAIITEISRIQNAAHVAKKMNVLTDRRPPSTISVYLTFRRWQKPTGRKGSHMTMSWRIPTDASDSDRIWRQTSGRNNE